MIDLTEDLENSKVYLQELWDCRKALWHSPVITNKHREFDAILAKRMSFTANIVRWLGDSYAR